MIVGRPPNRLLLQSDRVSGWARRATLPQLVAVLTALVVVTPLAGQESAPHQMILGVRDVDSSARWFSEALGFSVDRSGDAVAHLHHGDASLELRHDPNPSAPALIKVAILVSNLDAVFRQAQHAVPEDIIVEPSELPAVERLEWWPDRHFLLRHPDGVLVQVFSGGTTPTWFLAAVTVPALDEAAAWFETHTEFEEVVRPDYGDPRTLMRAGSFFLEVGEFGEGSGPEQSGILLDTRQPISECRVGMTPQGIELRTCRADPR